MRALLVALLFSLGCRTQTPRAAAVAYRFRCDPPQARIIIDEEDRGPCVVWQDRWMGLGPGVHRLPPWHSALGLGDARYLLGHGADLADVLSRARRPPEPRLRERGGSVTNHAATTGPALDAAAQEGVASALAERAEVTTLADAGGRLAPGRGRRRAGTCSTPTSSR